MTCRILRDVDGKGIVFLCSRDGKRKSPCKQCGKPSTKLCDFPLIGKGKRKTCDVHLCEACATEIDPARLPQQFAELVQEHDSFDVCPAHHRFIKKKGLKNENMDV